MFLLFLINLLFVYAVVGAVIALVAAWYERKPELMLAFELVREMFVCALGWPWLASDFVYRMLAKRQQNISSKKEDK